MSTHVIDDFDLDVRLGEPVVFADLAVKPPVTKNSCLCAGSAPGDPTTSRH
ncbi:hypothetical protein [Kibdelosporangium aridum]|uniref:hypothetical protein n=1 Tax=Kibdelosporangium aridum TaxID=2030 RepID=UPI000ACA13F5|nr:hypothetical protein [Kibdelosporangium aridum]